MGLSICMLWGSFWCSNASQQQHGVQQNLRRPEPSAGFWSYSPHFTTIWVERDGQYPVLLQWEVLGWSCAEAPVAFFTFQVPNERLSITDALGRSHRHFGYNPWKSWKWAWDRQGQAIDWIDLANGSKSVNPKPSGWSKITSACASPELQTTPRRFPTLSIKRGKWSRNKPHVRCIRYKSVFVVACLCAVSGTSNKS